MTQTETKRRILVAEDDLTNQKLLRFALTKMGYGVTMADNGEEAVRLAQSEQPDLLLLDLYMPIMDGFRAIQSLKTDPRTAAIPIIAVTTRTLLSDRLRAKEAGCVDYISKPFEIRELREVLEKHLQTA